MCMHPSKVCLYDAFLTLVLHAYQYGFFLCDHQDVLSIYKNSLCFPKKLCLTMLLPIRKSYHYGEVLFVCPKHVMWYLCTYLTKLQCVCCDFAVIKVFLKIDMLVWFWQCSGLVYWTSRTGEYWGPLVRDRFCMSCTCTQLYSSLTRALVLKEKQEHIKEFECQKI